MGVTAFRPTTTGTTTFSAAHPDVLEPQACGYCGRTKTVYPTTLHDDAAVAFLANKYGIPEDALDSVDALTVRLCTGCQDSWDGDWEPELDD